MLRIFGTALLLVGSAIHIDSCGVATHEEIINRAQAHYNNQIFGDGEVKRILKERAGAFQAGAPFPDAFYSPLCHNGDFHDISEDTHWGLFQKTAFDYFHKKYPDPIGNKNAENLLAFLLGMDLDLECERLICAHNRNFRLWCNKWNPLSFHFSLVCANSIHSTTI